MSIFAPTLDWDRSMYDLAPVTLLKTENVHKIRRGKCMDGGIFSLELEKVRRLVEKNEVSVCVVGIGRIGLPTTLMFARSGFQTVGVDIDAELVARLASGDFSLKDEPGLEDVFRQVIGDGRFQVTTSLEDGVSHSDIIVLSLPTPVTGNNIPDYSALRTVGRQLGDLARAGSIIVVESTIEPGFLENEFLGLVEGGKAGLGAGHNVGVGVCPEAANPGEILKDFARLPRLVGATDGETAKKIADIYRHAFSVDFRMVPDCKTANAAKLVANVFRDVNIAFVNELALLFDRLGIDTKAVLEAADSKYNFQIHYPGAGVGGPCLPANSYQLLNSARAAGGRLPRIIDAGRQVNEQMPIYVVELLKDALREAGKEIESSVVLILGISYKPDIRDMQVSPAESVILEARRAGTRIKIYDPYFKGVTAYGIHTESSFDEAISGADAAVIVTAHAEFQDIRPEYFAKMRTPVLVDARGIVDARLAEEAGLVFRGLGRGRNTNN